MTLERLLCVCCGRGYRMLRAPMDAFKQVQGRMLATVVPRRQKAGDHPFLAPPIFAKLATSICRAA